MYNSRNGFGFNIQDNAELKEYLAEHTTNASKSCTLIWFVDQVTGETKLWTGEVKDPYNIRYQNTEELDQIKITLLSFLHHKTVFSSKIKNLTKVIIIHEATIDNYLPTYDSKGKPLNHDQFVIVDGTCSLRQGNGHYFEHEYTLAEPLYGLRYWATETQTITNMTSITISELNDSDEWEQKTYTQEETNLYYVLKRMLQITGYRTSVEDCTLDTLISIQDQALLTNSCKGINDNFMASNAYQCIIKMAKYLDRLPVLYFNPNYEVQDSNNLDESKKEYLLFFEQKTSGKIYQEDEVFTDISGYCECELAAKDAGTVVVDAQNLVSSTPVWYPGYGYFCAATGDRGKITLAEDSYISIKLPTSIAKVLSIKAFRMKEEYDDSSWKMENEIIDIPCVEEQEWINIASTSERKKYFYYKKYSNVIEINHSNYKYTYDKNLLGTIVEFQEFYFSIQYIPALDARIKMSHSNKYETSITQTDAALDSKAFGTFLKNYAKENCNTDYSLSRTYYSIDKILKPGDSVKMKNGGRLIVASTDITRKNNSYFVIYVLNEYRVKRSSLISASNRIDNKIINKESTMKRFININEKPIKVGLSVSFKKEELNLNYIMDSRILVDAYTAFQPDIKYLPNVAYTKINYIDGYSQYFSLVINKCQSGNAVILNINAEDSTVLFGGGYNRHLSGNKYYKYSDCFGKINTIDILASDYDEGYTNIFHSLINGNTNLLEEELIQAKLKVIDYANIFPSILEEFYNEKLNFSPIKIENLLILKDTNETLNISLQVNFIEYDSDTILFDKFVELNSLINDNNIEDTTPGINSALGLIVVNRSSLVVDASIEDLVDIHPFITCSRLRGELVESNVIKYSLDETISLKNEDQIILVKYQLNGNYTHIYPLISKTIYTDTKINTAELYLDFNS